MSHATVAPFHVFHGARRDREAFACTAEERELIEQIRTINGLDKVKVWVGFLALCQSMSQRKRQ